MTELNLVTNEGSAPAPKRPRLLYLAGPMRNYVDLNRAAFSDMARRLRAQGFDVINPFDFNVPDGEPIREYMKVDLSRGVLMSDALAMITGWEKSQGACIEATVAQEVGLKVYDAECLVQGCYERHGEYRRAWIIGNLHTAVWDNPDAKCEEWPPQDSIGYGDADASNITNGPGVEVKLNDEPRDETILEEAQRLTHVDRQGDYGHPEEDFTRTTGMINACFGLNLDATDWPKMMMLAKIAREHNKHKRDNVVDIAGYANTLDMVHQRREGR